MFRSPYVDVGWVPTYHRLAPPFQQIIDIWESWRGLFVGLGSERVNDCSEVMLSKNIPSGFRSDGIRLLFQSRQSRRLWLTSIIIIQPTFSCTTLGRGVRWSWDNAGSIFARDIEGLCDTLSEMKSLPRDPAPRRCVLYPYPGQEHDTWYAHSYIIRLISRS